LDADIEPPSEASYLDMSPNTSTDTPARIREDNLFPTIGTPTTPSNVLRNQADIDALSDLVDAITREHGLGFIMDSAMDMEETEEEEEEEEEEEADLDAEIEDMDENSDSEDDMDDEI
jgi:hypothetical protein